MRHLKPEEVNYVTRPMTVFEHHIDQQLQRIRPDAPDAIQLWTMFLWSRQNEVLPKELFADILITDWDDHITACRRALHAEDEVRNVLKQLDDSWRFNYREQPFDKSRLDEWLKTNS